MANYNVQITRRLRFSANRKANDVVIKRTLRLLARGRRDEWIENCSGSSGGGAGGTVKRRVRFKFP